MSERRLRRFRDDDFEDFHAIVSDYEVVKMLVIWPHPADPGFTRMRMNTPEAKAGQVLVIEVDGELAGSVGMMAGGMGYFLARKFWGRGIANWAVAKMLAKIFADPAIEEVTACVWHGNPASEKVLMKNGFKMGGVCEDYCEARGERLKNNRFRLSRADWAARRG